MGPILVIHPQGGLLDVIQRMLANAYEVEVFQDDRRAEQRLATGTACEAVLCGLDQPARAMKIFEKTCECSPAARLIPIARDLNQVSEFREQWESDTQRKEKSRKIGQEWLPERCTAGDILALFPAVTGGSAKSTETNMGTNMEASTATAEKPTPERKPKPSQGEAASAPGLVAQDPERPDEERGTDHLRLRRAGTVIDGYQLICCIGQGGFGTHWMCVNTTTERLMAMKFVEGEEQMVQELDALRKYVHAAQGSAHLIPIEHINSDESCLWFVTPLADSLTGGYTTDSYRSSSLANELQAKGHLAEMEAVRVGVSIARGLMTLHHAGLLHGDVASGNIVRIRDRWLLADPGLVRFLGAQGICRNRAYYPDLKACRAADDLYALGVVLWEMVSGIAEMASGKDRLRLDGKLLAVLLQTELPIAKVICRAAAENPEQRYLNAEEMLRDLESLAASLATQTGPGRSLYQLPKIRSLRTSCSLPPLD